MMTMTELFYGPIEPTWIVHPESPVFKRQNGENPYLTTYGDEALTHRRYPYMQRAGHGSAGMYPYNAQYFVRGANHAVHNHSNGGGIQKHRQAGVLQPRNAINTQTVHFMVPLCCDKCEDTVKNQLLDLDDVQRVTCDQWKHKVTVTSAGIAPERLLKRLQKIKKRTTFWPTQYHHKSTSDDIVNGSNQMKLQHHHNVTNTDHSVINQDDEN